MKTREQAESRALELFPIHEEFDVDRLKELRESYLQGWEEAQQDKQTCGFCVETATELTNEKHSESLDTKENEGSELPSEKQEQIGQHDQVNDQLREALMNIESLILNKDNHKDGYFKEFPLVLSIIKVALNSKKH